ncbi:MAG TPA: glycosyltransferase [Vicinamibacterales bacterium]|nr:glycosyltransferase [Vicinamibacterales bacterium]
MPTFAKTPAGKKIALVHDWLTGMRGGERVLEVICERFPGAELFTLVHVPGSVSPTIEGRPIHTSFVQHLPFVKRHYRAYLPLFPTAVERFRFDRFDFVLSVSHCCVKSVITPPGVPHVCYCLTPMRYAWDQFDAYFGPDRIGAVGSAVMRPVMAHMAGWDKETAGRPDRYVAISHYVAGRIGRYYNREATVVYPPVDTAFFTPSSTSPEPFALVVSALVPYKRIDLAIDACREARIPLKIVGSGPERDVLERRAAGSAQFLGRLADADIRDLYRRAAVVMLPGEEDFGIVPLEAQACGRPVIALARGGAVETVLDGETGTLVKEASAAAFAEAITHTMTHRFDTAAIRRHAEGFGRERFGNDIEAVVAAGARA